MNMESAIKIEHLETTIRFTMLQKSYEPAIVSFEIPKGLYF